MRPALAAIALAGVTACSEPAPVFTPEAIPLALAGGTGGLLGIGTAGDRVQPFPLLIDTASPLTAFSDGSQPVRATRGTLTVFGNPQGVTGAARLELHDIQLLVTPLGGTGLDTSNPVSGVLGGDNLRRFVLGLRYDPAPALSLSDRLVLDDCDLAERCATVLPFSLAGGRQIIDIGEDLYSYPASYVLLDACVEPSVDPLERDLTCSTFSDCGDRAACAGLPADQQVRCEQAIDDCHGDADHYLPRGIDVRLAVASGFSGLALTSAAYDRLRGRGSAAQVMADAPHVLYLPDRSVDAAGVMVGLGTLGIDGTSRHDPAARAALALVHRDGYFGACAELARSRRLRRVPTDRAPAAAEAHCLRAPGEVDDSDPLKPLLEGCLSKRSFGECADGGDASRTAAYVELGGPLPVIVVPDTISLLQSINADVRPDSATVEGVIGTEVLRRLGTTIDYPKDRAIFTCADPSCRVYRAMGHGTQCRVDLGDGERLFGGGRARLIPGGGCATP